MSDERKLLEPQRSEGTVVLPCEPDQFRDFIAGLLGRPQTISRRISGPFEVTRRDIENLFHLMEQRVSSQNDATLIQFTARIVYDDNSSVLLNSFADFQAYSEVKPLVSTAVHLSWTYLIQFRNKKVPEKQQIDISFSGSSHEDADTIVHTGGGLVIRSGHTDQISIRISHTDRTWGTDIESLLSGHVELLLKPATGMRALANKYSGKVGLCVGILVFISALVAGFNVTDQFIEKYMAMARSFQSSGATSFEAVAQRVDFLISVIASGMWTRYAFYVTGLFILSIIAAIILGGIVTSYAESERPSFVVLTKRAEEDRTKRLARYERNWWIFTASVLGSLILSVIGNFIFHKMVQYWTL
jgi:hypothetical protein